MTGTGTGLTIWQTVDVSRKAVVTLACWSWFYPIIWILLAVVHHVLAVLCLRFTLELLSMQRTSSTNNLAKGSTTQDAKSVLSKWNLR